MASRVEDYALIGDCHTAALTGRDGSIDWLCAPRFDSKACFAALLGEPEHGRWQLAPVHAPRRVRRCYRTNTLILETEFETEDGTVALIDCMVPAGDQTQMVRLVEGRRGRVAMQMELIIRFDYGSVVPWVRRMPTGIQTIAGPDMLNFYSPIPMRGENFRTLAEFTVGAGERVPFVMVYSPSHRPPPPAVVAEEGIAQTERWWREWAGRGVYQGPWREAVMRSLITLKALTYAPTGGIVAAATTSLPEWIGGKRNWDYRYCWLRDATFTLYALLNVGYHDEAQAWREWLLQAVAGKPSDLQIMYGIAGERRLTEWEADWLPGYEQSRPVRIGNAAHGQLQLDVYGELLDALYQCRRVGLDPDPDAWRVELAVLDCLESTWRQPDNGIWEVRGSRRHFTHSKIMAWVAFDRAVKNVENYRFDGPVDRWRRIRDAIHAEVCQKGFSEELGAFVQYYGPRHLDASLLMTPLVGFLPASDPRVRGTVDAIQRNLMQDGLAARYRTVEVIDGLPAGEGAFLACTFWLVDNLILLGREAEARDLFESLLALRNDVGLLSEEYDPQSQRLVGNFPQAFSHVGLVNSAHNFAENGPASHRSGS